MNKMTPFSYILFAVAILAQYGLSEDAPASALKNASLNAAPAENAAKEAPSAGASAKDASAPEKAIKDAPAAEKAAKDAPTADIAAKDPPSAVKDASASEKSIKDAPLAAKDLPAAEKAAKDAKDSPSAPSAAALEKNVPEAGTAGKDAPVAADQAAPAAAAPVATDAPASTASKNDDDDPLFASAKKTVQRVNSKQHRKWRAEMNEEFARMSPERRGLLAGVPLNNLLLRSQGPVDELEQKANTEIPKEFDVRKRWPKCAPAMETVRTQGNCADCWAVSTEAMITDRLCIRRLALGKEPHPQTLHMSSVHLTACTKGNSIGCKGGYPQDAIAYVVKNRLVTGSLFQEHNYCKPYPWNKYNSSEPQFSTPECKEECTNSKYEKSFQDDLTILGNGTGLRSMHMERRSGPAVVAAIQSEIMERGPVTALFIVYDEFYYYKDGIYEVTNRDHPYGHAIRIMGWGEDTDASNNTQPYWLIANSWGKGWGDQGYFRIMRGQDEAGIESMGIDYLIIDSTDV